MKKKIFTAISLLLTLSICFSQDIIVQKSNEDLQAKVLEVTPTEIKYKKYDYQDGPVYTILKSDVLMVRYENGTKDIFDETNNEIKTSEFQPSGNLFFQGNADASRHYGGYKPAGTGTLILSLISPIVGLIPAIATSVVQPRDHNLNYPNSELMKNPEYYMGYTKRAKKIKQGKVWANWGIAFGLNLFAIMVLLN